ncbi:MAG: helix-turn-helix transcriptional regulator [Cyanobacteria bacterium]|nr:helix-turn-helix transcriptional regulator [Cyanobacteriota bacterium]
MGQWTVYILWYLCKEGPLRFGALKRAIGSVSAKVLTERLRQLEQSGIIYRECVPSSPPQVTYGLTERGKELIGVLDGLNEIARRWAAEDPDHPFSFEHEKEQTDGHSH